MPDFSILERNGVAVHRMANSQIAALISPSRGADMLGLQHVPTKTEVLWHNDRSTSAPIHGSDDSCDSSFYDQYPGGVQELFPNAGPACTYEGAPLPFHGEACRVPWEYEVLQDEQRLVVEYRVRLARMPFDMTRRIILEASWEAVKIESTIVNRSAQRLPAIWGFHPAFGGEWLQGTTKLFMDASEAVADVDQFGSQQVHAPGSVVEWDQDGKGFDLSPGSSETADLIYVMCKSGWFALHNLDNGICVSASWPTETFPYVWLWQECHDRASYPWWGRHHVVGVEPQSSWPARGLAQAVANGAAISFEPFQQMTVELTLGVRHLEPGQIPAGVSEDGTLQCANYDQENK